MRKRLREGALDDKEIEVELAEPEALARDHGPAGMEEMAEQLKGLFAQPRRQGKRQARAR